MGINKKQYISILDLWTITDIFGISEHSKDLEIYTHMNLDDESIHSFALEIAKYYEYRFLTESDIAYIMTRIAEYIVIEYESSESSVSVMQEVYEKIGVDIE